MRGKEANQANSCFSFKCPYQATVIKILETINSPIVINPFIQYNIDYQLFIQIIFELGNFILLYLKKAIAQLKTITPINERVANQ